MLEKKLDRKEETLLKASMSEISRNVRMGSRELCLSKVENLLCFVRRERNKRGNSLV